MVQYYPIIPANSIPFITVEQMIEEYKISLIQMMENASHNLALLSKTLYPKIKNFIVLAGKGSTGELGGYQGGLAMKWALLELEGIRFSEKGKVVSENIFYPRA